jgi:hypothetical protein
MIPVRKTLHSKVCALRMYSMIGIPRVEVKFMNHYLCLLRTINRCIDARMITANNWTNNDFISTVATIWSRKLGGLFRK